MASYRVPNGTKASAFASAISIFKRVSYVGVSAFALTLASASPAAAHSIHQALARFYEQNPSVKALQLGVGSSNESINQASGAALPQVNLGINPSVSRTYGYSGENGNVMNGGTGDHFVNNGSLGMTLSVTQQVDLSGSIGNQIESAFLGLQNGWTGYYAQEQGLFLDAVNIYMNVISSRATASLSNGSVSLLEAQMDAAQARFDAGVGTRTDIANIDAALQGERARTSQAAGNRAVAEANFRRVFGIEPTGLEFPNHVPNLPRSLREAVDRAMLSDPTLQQAEAALRIAELNIASAKAQNGPSMSLTASARHDHDLLRNSNDNSTSFAASSSINIPLYQGGAGVSRVRQAEIDRDVAKAQLAAQREQTRTNVINAWNNLQTAEASLNSIVSQVTASELALRGARAEQDAGEKTFIDTLDAENALTSSQVSLSTTRAQVVVAGYAVLQAVGNLTAEKLSLPVSGGYFRPSDDLEKRRVNNYATALYLGEDRATATPSFVRWLYNNASDAVVRLNKNNY